MVITGAGPGIMEAGHEGAGPENVSSGVNIRLPWEQSANPVIAEKREADHLQIFFHAQADLHPPLGRHRAVSRRLWHPGRSLRSHDARPDRQEPVAHAARARGPARRHLLEDVGQASPRTSLARQVDFARRLEPLSDHRQHGRSREDRRAFLSQLPFHALGEGSFHHPPQARAEFQRPSRR